MINLYTETNFCHDFEREFINWIEKCITDKNFILDEINYIFVDDIYLHKMNMQFLDHDTYTDIITFDYSVGKNLSADIYISIDRIRENSESFKTDFYNELARVMIHGILHLMKFKDKTSEQKTEMRQQEDFCLQQLQY
jgi:rRNA maturation RNase YbeY